MLILHDKFLVLDAHLFAVVVSLAPLLFLSFLVRRTLKERWAGHSLFAQEILCAQAQAGTVVCCVVWVIEIKHFCGLD
jgi:hypothetical protein